MLHKIHAGYYEAVDGRNAVTVLRNPELQGAAKWIAYAQWDHRRVIDPVLTMQEATQHAEVMLAERAAEIAVLGDTA